MIGTDKNPQAPGAGLADKFCQVSYTDIKGLKQVANSENFTSADSIFTAAAHFAYEGAAEVAEYCEIPYISKHTVGICLDKSKFYRFLEEQNVPVPKTQIFNPLKPDWINPSKIYFLKSDYGKSPHYCYRIVNGEVPRLPDKFDLFYRKNFLLQEEITGTHFRLNYYSGQVSVFLKLGDSASVPLQTIGMEHRMIVKKLSKVLNILGLTSYLVKFDLIINETGWYVIDIGLDPPLRLMLLCNHIGFDFPMAYIKHYLMNDQSSLPVWTEICKPVVISGAPHAGFTFTDFS